MFENRGRGIGERGRDNGLLILLAVKDRQVRVEVGYELEAFITDGFSGETSREEMIPFVPARRLRRGAAGRHVANHQPDRPGAQCHAAGRSSGAAPWRSTAGIGWRPDRGVLRAVHHRQPDRGTHARKTTIPRRVGRRWRLVERRRSVWRRIRRRVRSGGGFGGGFGGFGGGRSGGGGGGGSW